MLWSETKEQPLEILNTFLNFMTQPPKAYATMALSISGPAVK